MSIRNDVKISTKIAIIGLIIFTLIACLVPVYQVGVNQQKSMELRAKEQMINQLQENIKVLEAQISFAKSPEALITQVIEQKLDYKNIDYSSSYRLAKASV